MKYLTDVIVCFRYFDYMRWSKKRQCDFHGYSWQTISTIHSKHHFGYDKSKYSCFDLADFVSKYFMKRKFILECFYRHMMNEWLLL